MLKALVIKELRESAGIAALAALALLYALGELTGIRILPWRGQSYHTYPFVYDELPFFLSLCVGGLAIALGLKQTAWESGQGTYFFLLHRPVSRARVFVCKLAVGLAWVLAAAAILILLYAWWAATPGHVAGPFFWSMTESAWQRWLVLPVVYLGAFLSGIRPGKWFGSRLAPLAASMFVAVLAANMPWLWATLLISLAAATLIAVTIFYYVRWRDY
jgi:hypothetical protein